MTLPALPQKSLRPFVSFAFALGCLVAPAAPAAPADLSGSDPAVIDVKPQIEKLDDDHYRIGKVMISQVQREIRMPAKVNMDRGILEYLLSTAQGKIHEALLVTEVSPVHLRTAFVLLRYPASPELFPIIQEDASAPERYPKVPRATRDGARIAIEVEWNDGGTTRRQPVNRWFQHAVKSTSMAPGPWLYTGSDFNEGRFMAAVTGDLAALLMDQAALINYPGSDNGDNVWVCFPKRVPAVDTPVTVIISPFVKKPRPSEP